VIDFRYHLVSIIAVFLALAVGLVVGSTALSGKAEEALTAAQHRAISENTSLRKEKNQLQQELAGDQAFAAASSERLLAGLLTGERVVLIAAPGADSTELTGLTTALRQSGATVTGQVNLTSAFTTTTGQTEAALSQLAQQLASKAGLVLTAQSASPISGQEAAAQVLAASLVSSSDSLTSTASQEILTGFGQAGFVSVASGAPADAPAELAVLVTPSGSPQQSVSQVLVAVAQELKVAGSETVMAGAVSSIGPGSAINAEVSAGNIVSTVDNADTEIGQITVVQALRFLLNGKSPAAWGAEPAAAPSPAPTPVSTPTSKPSPSSTAKSHA
jgi:Copper transport outer membrane protein, MctB